MVVNKNCYNCRYLEAYDEGEYGFAFLCKKGCMNTDGYFDWKFHKFTEEIICPLWKEK